MCLLVMRHGALSASRSTKPVALGSLVPRVPLGPSTLQVKRRKHRQFRNALPPGTSLRPSSGRSSSCPLAP